MSQIRTKMNTRFVAAAIDLSLLEPKVESIDGNFLDPKDLRALASFFEDWADKENGVIDIITYE